jgi:bla regulator protein BlaR1
MLFLILECAIRAALIVAGVAFLLYAFRVRAAAVKHRVWTAAVLVMLVLPVWTAWGPKAPVRVLPALTQRVAREGEPSTVTPRTETVLPNRTSFQKPESERNPLPKWPVLLFSVYLFGLLSLLARLAIGTVNANRLARRAEKCEGQYSSSACAAPVTVGWFRPKVILPGSWRQWPEHQLEIVLTHEREHARRRDPLVQWLALLNRAFFWFHPAAWWLENELSSLAEEACDSAVLACGHDARDYAEILMNMAGAVMRSGARVSLVGMAMPGTFLPRRIRKIIERTPVPRLSRVRAACLTAACAITCSAFAAGMLARPQQQQVSQDWETAAGGKMAFDVASVKVNKSGLGNETTNAPLDPGNMYTPSGGLFTATNFRVLRYISFAYKMNMFQTLNLERQLPKWALSEKFDIQARAAGSPTKDQTRLMMQTLLADRFKLAMHTETRQLPIFALVLVNPQKTGLQLRPYPDRAPCDASTSLFAGEPRASQTVASVFPDLCGGFAMMQASAPGRIKAGGRNVSIQVMADPFPAWADSPDRPVFDRTGLTGTYDFAIEFTPHVDGPTPPGVNFQPDPTGPTFQEALKEQLGLKMESTTGPVDVFVIDNIEEPSAN